MSEAPDYYRGIKVPEVRKQYWNKPTMRAWRDAVDSTLNAALFAVKRGLADLKKSEPMYHYTEWSEGAFYGREEVREEIMDEFHRLLVDDSYGATTLGNL